VYVAARFYDSHFACLFSLVFLMKIDRLTDFGY
jgi:hypothetical protein